MAGFLSPWKSKNAGNNNKTNLKPKDIWDFCVYSQKSGERKGSLCIKPAAEAPNPIRHFFSVHYFWRTIYKSWNFIPLRTILHAIDFTENYALKWYIGFGPQPYPSRSQNSFLSHLISNSRILFPHLIYCHPLLKLLGENAIFFHSSNKLFILSL